MDKLYAIKIRQSDGTYGAAIPVSVLAENVDWNSTLSLVDILGQVDTSASIQDQINSLKNTRATQASVNALDQKVDNAVEYMMHNSLIADAREGVDGTEYNSLKERLDTEYNILLSEGGQSVIMVNEEPVSATKMVVETSNDQIELALMSDLDTLNDKIERNIVILGDSWCDVDQEYGSGKWPALLANMNPEVHIHNYSKGGSRIIGADNYALNGTVGGQIATAIADTSYDHDYIDTIIIFGGINDFRSISTVNNQAAYDLADDIKSKILNRLKPEFPNAEYVYISNNSIPASHAQYMYFTRACRFLSFLTSCRAYSTIGWVNPSYYRSDHIHPDDNGHKMLLSNIRAILFGGNIVYTWPTQASISLTDGSKSVNMSLIQSVTENAIITQITWNCTSSSIPNTTTMTGNLTDAQLHNLVYFPAWFATCNLVNNGANFAASTVKTEYVTAPSLSGTRNEVVDGKITLYTQPISAGVGLGYLISNNNW